MSATAPEDGVQDAVLAELSPVLFASLPRSDQRRKGLQYVRGLLSAQGRKSIRSIAALDGADATEQNLHHFICDSTWSWTPVRRALAGYLAGAAPPAAWVLRQMVIPKAGAHSVGVERCFVPSLGQVVSVQRAVGVWSAAEELTAPVHWRLHLSGAWLADERRRSRAQVPPTARPETLGDCAVEAYLDSTAGSALDSTAGSAPRPVVLDARELDAARVIGRLRAAGAPVLARISGTLPLVPLAAASGATATAGQVVAAARDLRRPVVWSGRGAGRGLTRTSLVGAVPVRLPGAREGGRPDPRPGLLLGVGPHGPRWPVELWFTDVPGIGPAAAFRLSRLLGAVDEDSAISDRVGLRDFAGRSFGGWHRHVTLASAAHAVAALTDGRDRSASYAS